MTGRIRARIAFAIGASSLSLCNWAAAQQWVAVETAVGVQRMPVAYDSHRNRVLTIGDGGKAYEHDGRSWARIGPLPSGFGPAVNAISALLAYQPHRGRTLAVGPDYVGGGIDTYEFDGDSWIARAPDHRPPTRHSAMMCCDSLRHRVVLYGGVGGTVGYLDDTWEWDGSDWERKLPFVAPPRRSMASMAFDSARGVTVLLGGVDHQGYRFDHWEYDGLGWTQRQPATIPGTFGPSRMAFDAQRSRMVLYGGLTPQPIPVADPQPFEFDGIDWVHRQIATAPPGHVLGGVVAVDHGIRIFGGTDAYALGLPREGCEQQVFDYDGVQFVERRPLGDENVYGAYDAVRGRTVLVGQQLDVGGYRLRTREWDGYALADVQVANPSGRRAPTMAGGPNGTVVLFGGNVPPTFLGDTWTFDGVQWLQHNVPGPSPRVLASMAYDAARGVTVLFGGLGPNGDLGDTWEWDGTAWAQVQIAGPSPRGSALMAYDPLLGRCILTGGFPSGWPEQFETWSYDGIAWTLSPAQGGGPGQGMAFDPAVGAVLLFFATQTGYEALQLGASGWYPVDSGNPEVRIAGVAEDPNGRLLAYAARDGGGVQVRFQQPGTVANAFGGCSASGSIGHFALHDPLVVDRTLRPLLLGAGAGQLAIVAGSFQQGFSVYGGCFVMLSNPFVMAIGATNAVGQFGLAIDVPRAPALEGVTFLMQSLTGEVAGPIGGMFGMSRALRVQLHH